ncbi:hypothetical protein KCU95_g11496, partial [Aureobasidium melanogenum]
MHGSLNIFIQRVSKIGMRSSLQTDELSVPSNHTSSKSGPLTSCTVPRIPIVSLPVPGTFVDLCGSQGPSKNVPPDYSSLRTKRKPTEMPLSCHLPFQKSWVEVQPLQTHIPRPKAYLRADIRHSSANAPSLEDDARKESPEAKTSRPYHGIILPPPPPIPHTRQRRKRSHGKPSEVISQDTTSINLFEQPIAPLTPRYRKSATPCPEQSSRPSGAGLKTRSNPAAKITAQRVASHSSHVIQADDSLQLEVFSELDAELDEVMGLYTASKMS